MRGFPKLSLVALLTVSCVVVSVAPADAVTEAERKVAVGLRDKINAKRASLFQLGALTEIPGMTNEAEYHSAYQAQAGRLSHDGFCDQLDADPEDCENDGNELNSRIDRIWYYGTGIGFVCENVARTTATTAKDAIRFLFKLWKNSEPHHDCMFDRNGYTTTWMGIGIKKKGSRWYATFLAAEDSSPSSF